jgi:hypothetical protein
MWSGRIRMRSSRLTFNSQPVAALVMTTDMRRKIAIAAPGMWLRAAIAGKSGDRLPRP